MSDQVEIKCPKCAQRMRVKRPTGPVQVTCPGCQQAMRIGGNPSATQPPPPKPRPQPAPAPAGFPGPAQTRANSRPANNGNSRSKLLLVAGIGLLAVVLGGVAFVVSRMGGDEPVADASSPSEPATGMDAARQRFEEARARAETGSQGAGLRQRMESEQAAFQANIDADLKRAEQAAKAASQNGVTVTVTKAQRQEASAASSTRPHQELMAEFVAIGRELEQTLKSVNDPSSRSAGTTKLRELTKQCESVLDRSTALEPLSKQQFYQVVSNVADQLQAHSVAVEAEVRRVAGQFSDAQFKRAVQQAAFTMKGAPDGMKASWSELLDPIGPSEQAAYNLVLIQRDLWRDVHAVQSKAEYDALKDRFAAASDLLRALAEKEVFWFRSKAFKPRSTYVDNLQTYAALTTAKLARLARLHGPLDGDQARADFEAARDSVVNGQGMPERKSDRAMSSNVNGDDGGGMNVSAELRQKIMDYRQRMAGLRVVSVVFYGNLLDAQKGATMTDINRTIGSKGTRPTLRPDPEESLAMFVYEGPLDDIVKIAASRWGVVAEVDEENLLIKVNL